ncbi:lytic murein transglycosylase [Nitratireductor kimnyeongensis]|uniref:Lytic murein transglycosylase n=1 Tax=Nitratireductor kimnyeongensis TaxID=430679 RepID=A0ABW0T9M5_9HYPH|nr:lytic murein transglycosylase [Nitratireductor kimnyeongensis]QZZ35948.1 lytic murein transglycosylase [Nitratireductor kimnyeongensis]
MRSKTILLGALFVFGLTGNALAQQCGGDFNAWREGVRQDAASDGVSERGLSALNGARIDQKVLERDRAQGVFNQTFAEFANRMINDYRLKNGAANLQKYADIFARAENEFGVPGPVIASFWALETDFGAVQGDFSTLNALATLAHDCRRPEIFRPQLIALLHLIDQGWVPADVTGAWAGEIGQMQMLPSDYYTKGVDGDGDGKVDLKGSSPDAILTAAKNLQSLGWKPGQPWMEEVRVPDQMAWEKTGRVNKLPRSEWAAMGVTRRDGSPLPSDGMPTGLVLPMGHKGLAFLVYDNYDIYLEWNQSLIYTLTAAHLAARLAGAPRFDVGSPEQGLAPETMKQLQTKLAARGHDVGKIDGILGAGTREAVRQEQLRLGLPADGWPTPTLFSNL